MATRLEYFMQESWLIVIFISIIFIFIIISRELGKQTRKHRKWIRSSYSKVLPRISLTFQHFTRRGEILSITNNGLCRSVHKDMLDYLIIKKGLNKSELEVILKDEELLFQEVPNKNAVEFLYDINSWLKKIIPEPSFFNRIYSFILRIIRDDIQTENEIFYLKLATVIYDFRYALDSVG